MALLDKRLIYAPFEYPQYYDYFMKQQQSHWLFTEVSMSGDLHDWNYNLSVEEKNLIGSILKSFVQAETIVQDYWGRMVFKTFRKPEIAMMATTFAAFEGIHAAGYAYLQDTLGLDDYAAFIVEPTAKSKIDRLLNSSKSRSKEDVAKSLAVFSAFTEGVSLFSSFAILLNFSRFNKLKGVAQIIAWSIKDELIHSEAGCSLFNLFVKEYPEIWTDDLKKDIVDAARATVELEDGFIDKAFELGDVEGLTAYDVKQFIRQRCNSKLQEVGLPQNWRNLDKEALKRMEWFDVLSMGNLSHADFFAVRVTDYSKGSKSFDDIF